MGPPGIWSTASSTPISESPTGLQPYGSAHYPPPAGSRRPDQALISTGLEKRVPKAGHCPHVSRVFLYHLFQR